MSIEAMPTAEPEEAAAPNRSLSATEANQSLAGSLADAVLDRLRALPPDRQQQVLDFAEFLVHKQAPKQPRRSLKGLWADLNIQISEEDLAEARREMWGNFPRDDI